jgi:hypothetical protein
MVRRRVLPKHVAAELVRKQIMHSECRSDGKRLKAMPRQNPKGIHREVSACPSSAPALRNPEIVQMPETRTRTRHGDVSAGLRESPRGFRLVLLSIHRNRSRRRHNQRGHGPKRRTESSFLAERRSLSGHTTNCLRRSVTRGASACLQRPLANLVGTAPSSASRIPSV